MLLWCWSVDSIVNGKSWKLVKMPWSYHIFMFMYSRCINALIYPMFLSRAKHVCVSMFVGTQGVHIPCHILLRRPKPTVTAKLWKHDIASCLLLLLETCLLGLCCMSATQCWNSTPIESLGRKSCALWLYLLVKSYCSWECWRRTTDHADVSLRVWSS